MRSLSQRVLNIRLRPSLREAHRATRNRSHAAADRADPRTAQQGAYVNEAAISHGIVTPILNALGWDSADPDQLVPEFSVPRGRVDLALFGLGHKPAVFIEVKQVGRAVDGDQQLQYAFHQGVPLCVLTDGREWSFYLPGGQGSYEDRRVYRLQLDDRDPAECERVLTRYLARARVRNLSAFEDAQRDYRDAAGQREAIAVPPRAWAELVAEAHELLIETVVDKAEALCGYKPTLTQVAEFLQTLTPGVSQMAKRSSKPVTAPLAPAPIGEAGTDPAEPTRPATDRAITFTLFGQTRNCANASSALVTILSTIVARDPAKVTELADAVRSRKRSHIARTPADINPDRPDLARAVEISPGWLVGLNIANREKITIIRAACQTFGITMPGDLEIVLPNA